MARRRRKNPSGQQTMLLVGGAIAGSYIVIQGEAGKLPVSLQGAYNSIRSKVRPPALPAPTT